MAVVFGRINGCRPALRLLGVAATILLAGVSLERSLSLREFGGGIGVDPIAGFIRVGGQRRSLVFRERNEAEKEAADFLDGDYEAGGSAAGKGVSALVRGEEEGVSVAGSADSPAAAGASALAEVQELPRIVLIALTRAGVALPELWQRWHDDFQEHLVAQGWAEEGSARNPWLGAFVSYHYQRDRAAVIEQLPPWMKGHVVVNPPPSAWSKVTGAMRETFRQALDAHPFASYFFVTSETSVPVKAARDLWAMAAADSRTRVDVMCPNHTRNSPKTSQFFMYSRTHLAHMVNRRASGNWDEWGLRWQRGVCDAHGGPDEMLLARALYWGRGLNVTGDCFPPAGTRANETERFDEVIQRYDQRLLFNTVGGLDSTTFVGWRENPIEAFGSGYPLDHFSHPLSFTHLRPEFLYLLNQNPNTMFLRKVTNTTTVLAPINEPSTHSPLISNYFQDLNNTEIAQEQLSADADLPQPMGKFPFFHHPIDHNYLIADQPLGTFLSQRLWNLGQV